MIFITNQGSLLKHRLYFIVDTLYEEEEIKEKETWLLNVDGSSTVSGAGAGIVMTKPGREYL